MGRSAHCWAGTEWVQQCFSPTLNPYITDALSAPAATQLVEELEPEEYDKLLGNDGMGLRVPSDLDHSICSYEALSDSNREKFDRAAFWFSTSSRMYDISISAAFAALVSAIESLTATGKIDSCIVPSPALVENLKGASEALRGPQYRETSRQIIESVCLPTDDQER